jgi:hypothetical protein
MKWSEVPTFPYMIDFSRNEPKYYITQYRESFKKEHPTIDVLKKVICIVKK